MPDFKGNCSATAIGSFPHLDPDAACELVLKTLPEIPCWPQLPKRGIQEEMCIQYTEGIPSFKLLPKEKRFYLETCVNAQELEALYDRFLKLDSSAFPITRGYATGLYAMEKYLSRPNHFRAVKGQTIGPITLAANLKDETQVPALFNDTFFDAIVKLLCLKAIWQVSFLSRYKLQVILFADEPYLSCMGSAFATITREKLACSLNEIFMAVKSSGAISGIHCCGNTDWSTIMDTEVDILSFDAFWFMDRVLAYWQDIERFLGRGGILAWGIAPTSSDSLKDISVEGLMDRMEKGIDYLSRKGIKRQTLLENSLITPSCGTGTLSVDESEKAMRLTCEVSSRLKERYGLGSPLKTSVD